MPKLIDSFESGTDADTRVLDAYIKQCTAEAQEGQCSHPDIIGWWQVVVVSVVTQTSWGGGGGCQCGYPDTCGWWWLSVQSPRHLWVVVVVSAVTQTFLGGGCCWILENMQYVCVRGWGVSVHSLRHLSVVVIVGVLEDKRCVCVGEVSVLSALYL